MFARNLKRLEMHSDHLAVEAVRTQSQMAPDKYGIRLNLTFAVAVGVIQQLT